MRLTDLYHPGIGSTTKVGQARTVRVRDGWDEMVLWCGLSVCVGLVCACVCRCVQVCIEVCVRVCVRVRVCSG